MDQKNFRILPNEMQRDKSGKYIKIGSISFIQFSSVAQSCLTLGNPMDCSPPGSSVHGIFQARVLEWGAIAFSEPDWRGGVNSFLQSFTGRSGQDVSSELNKGILA